MKSVLKPQRRTNPPCAVDILDIARAFLAQNRSEYDFTEVFLEFSKGNYSEAKSIYSGIVSDSLCKGVDAYSTVSQLGALLFKSNPSNLDIKSLESEAISKFIHNEARMADINAKLGLDKSLPNLCQSDRDIIAKCRWWIARRLPPVNTVLSRILTFTTPGSGVTLDTVDRARSSYCYKYSEQQLGWYELGEIYHLPLLSSSKLHQLAAMEGVGHLNPTIHGSNKVTFVPKNVTSLRSIAIEPNGQMMMQLGIHSFLCKVLSRAGNDIRFQSRNQILAREASITGSHATIDLSSASDSISLALIYQLLPSDWFMMLYRNRAPKGTLPDGSEITYHKFSSMGNGMTFALETLVFFAICRAVCGSDLISVYGDDIIVPVNHARRLIDFLNLVGFEINEDKTFLEGPFRESCGSDWYNGTLVTPKYWRLSDKPTVMEVYEFINSCSRVAPRFNWGAVRDYLRKSISRAGVQLLFGPSYMPENSCIHAPETYLAGAIKRRWDSDLQCYRYRVLKFTASRKTSSEMKPYTALAMLRHGTTVSYLPLRRLGKHRVVWIA